MRCPMCTLRNNLAVFLWHQKTIISAVQVQEIPFLFKTAANPFTGGEVHEINMGEFTQEDRITSEREEMCQRLHVKW